MTHMSIGNTLKKARQDKQVTINEIYQQTRIHPDILAAMEEDKFDKINLAYVRSFLKEYASYLKLDEKKIIAEYDKLYPRQEPDSPVHAITEKEPPSDIDISKILKIAKPVAGVILIIFVLISFTKAAGWAIRKIASKKPQVAKQAKLVAPAKVIEEKKPPQAKAPIIAPSEALKLSIRTTDDVWIELKVDGKLIFKNILKKGSYETWKAKENFKIWTGNASAMKLDLNGNDLGSPGKGVIKDILITREGIKK